MDIEDLPPRPVASDPLRSIETEDLELQSRETLAVRIGRLEAEIRRTEAAIAKKASSHLAAEAFFRKG